MAIHRDAYEAWFAGELADLVDGATPADRDRNIGRTLSTFPDDDIDTVDIDRVSPEGDDVVRWCWGRDCTLMSQDEDLLLMSDGLMLPLLDEAARYCTKREYVLSIVAHHARDSLHHALWVPAPAVAERLAIISTWVAPAAAARSDEVFSYLSRLASYRDRRAVTLEEARERVRDLRRCDAGTEEADVTRDVASWVAPLRRANIKPGRLFINRSSGEMRAEED